MPIIDHGLPVLPTTVRVKLFGPSPIGMANPMRGVLTIYGNDPLPTADPLNPLGLPVAPGGSNPLAGAAFYVDHLRAPAARVAHNWHWAQSVGGCRTRRHRQSAGHLPVRRLERVMARTCGGQLPRTGLD